MFLNTYGVHSVVHQREASAALASLRRCGPRALVFVAAAALAFLQFLAPAVASDGCTVLNSAVLDADRYYEVQKSRFQAGDQMTVSGPAGQQILVQGFSPSPKPVNFPFYYTVKATDLTDLSSGDYFTFNYVGSNDAPVLPEQVIFSCSASPGAGAQSVTLNGLSRNPSVTVGTPITFTASSTSGQPVSFSVNTGKINSANCALSRGASGDWTLSASAAGVCTLAASVAASGTYDAFSDSSFISVTAQAASQPAGPPRLISLSLYESINGGELMTITGENLQNVTTILFGNKSIIVQENLKDATQIKVLVPTFAEAATTSGSPINVEVQAQGNDGATINSNSLSFVYYKLIYNAPAAMVGAKLMIEDGLTTLDLGGATGGKGAVAYTVTVTAGAGNLAFTSSTSSDGKFQVRGLNPGASTIQITASDSNGQTAASTFILTVAQSTASTPSLTSISPNLSVNGGERVTLTGANLSGVTSVSIGGYSIAGANITVSATQILFMAPLRGQVTATPGVPVDVYANYPGGVTNKLPFTYYPELIYALPAGVNNRTLTGGDAAIPLDLTGATGGKGPYTYTISANSNPGAVTFTSLTSSTGQFTVNAAGGGASNITVKVTDAIGQEKSALFTLQVTPSAPLAYTAPTFSPLTVEAPTTLNFAGASGGKAPYTYVFTNTNPSSSLAFTPDPVRNDNVVVKALVAGSYNISVKVIDAIGTQTPDTPITLTAVNPALQLAATQSTVNLTLQTPIASPIKVVNASGGNRTYSYSPNPSNALSFLGLRINGSGELEGTPNATFNGPITINVTSDTETKPVTFTLVIARPQATVILRASKPNPGRTDTVDFTASVSPATATGTVIFTIGATAYPAVALSNGEARLLGVGPLPDGVYPTTAVYSGNSLYDPVTSNTVQIRWGIRPDPTADKNVRAIVVAQAGAALRMAGMQIDTVQRRLETLHEDEAPGFVNGISISAPSGLPPGASPFDDPVLRGQGFSKGEAGKAVDRTFDSAFGREPERAPKKAASGSSFGDLDKSPIKVWTAGSVIFGGVQVSSLGVVSKSYFTLSGLTAGLDTQIMDGLRGGFAMSYSGEAADLGADGSRMNTRGVTGSLYASWRIKDRLFLDGSLGYGDLNFSTRRYDSNAASFITGQRRGKMVFGSLALSYDAKMGPLKYSPYARLDVIDATLNAYTEVGDEYWVLAFDKAGLGSRSLVLGLRGQYDFEQPWGVMSPTWRLEYRRALNGELTQMMTYVTDPTTSYSLTANGADRDSLSAALGLKAQSKRDLSASLEYLLSGGVKSGLQGQGMRGMVKMGF